MRGIALKTESEGGEDQPFQVPHMGQEKRISHMLDLALGFSYWGIPLWTLVFESHWLAWRGGSKQKSTVTWLRNCSWANSQMPCPFISAYPRSWQLGFPFLHALVQMESIPGYFGFSDSFQTHSPPGECCNSSQHKLWCRSTFSCSRSQSYKRQEILPSEWLLNRANKAMG